jgi:hypothetical protein
MKIEKRAVMKKLSQASRNTRIRFNTTVEGLPAQLVLQWQEKGLIRSKADALRQALLALAEKFSQLEFEVAKTRKGDMDEEF